MSSDQEIHIAVLPFLNISANPENEYFSDGITEEIINALAGIKDLKVISRTSSFYFKNRQIPLKDIAQKLNADIILEGSVRRSGNQVRITAQLINAAEDYHFWSTAWDRKLENIFEVQDEISLLIADKLREELGHFEIKDHLVEPQTESLDVFQLNLKARFHFNKWNPEDVQQAIDFWEKAIKIDDHHVESHLGLADAYGFLATTEVLPRAEGWQKAIDNTQHALRLNPNDAGAHYQLANIEFFTNCDFAAASRHNLRSIELKSNYPEAQQFMSFLYILRGDMERGLKHLKLALEINPLSQETWFYRAFYLYRSGNYVEALQQLSECLQHNPRNIPAFVVKAYVLIKLKRYEHIINMLDEAPASVVLPGEDLGLRCLVAILQNEKDRIKDYLEQLKESAKDPQGFQAHSYLFIAYVNLNEFEKAFDWLAQSLKKKSSIFLLSFSDPLVQELRKASQYAIFHKQLYPPILGDSVNNGHKKELLDVPTASKYDEQLSQLMLQEEPFLNPNLTLRSLAAQLEIHPNQLSWLLNNSYGKNFNSFINDYRINRFKELVEDPANSHISLIGLAFESGFNSKTVFNTYFKKSEGITPGAFQKQLKK